MSQETQAQRPLGNGVEITDVLGKGKQDAETSSEDGSRSEGQDQMPDRSPAPREAGRESFSAGRLETGHLELFEQS